MYNIENHIKSNVFNYYHRTENVIFWHMNLFVSGSSGWIHQEDVIPWLTVRRWNNVDIYTVTSWHSIWQIQIYRIHIRHTTTRSTANRQELYHFQISMLCTDRQNYSFKCTARRIRKWRSELHCEETQLNALVIF